MIRLALGCDPSEIGRTLLELSVEAGLDLPATCGGRGVCGHCLVRTEGALSPPTVRERELISEERLAAGWRLACQAEVSGPAVIECEEGVAPVFADWFIPNESNPAVRRNESAALGAVFDLGTTTVTGALIETASGNRLAMRTAFNAQRIYGADVISRLGRAREDPAARADLGRRLRAQVRRILQALLMEANTGPAALAGLVAVGNTTMEHFFLDIDPTGLAVAPFTPAPRDPRPLSASSLGLIDEGEAELYFPPNIAAFLGADALAGVMAVDLAGRPGANLLVDLGTNGEIVLAREGRLWACSTAAGPAFEGAGISCGMPARAGAVAGVYFDGDIRIRTIGEVEPAGVCGSGLIDAIAVLLQTGVIDAGGRLANRPGLAATIADKIRTGAAGNEVVLAAASDRDIVLTQGDIRQVQLAKGAVAAGVRLLCRAAGLESSELDRVFLAGSFGTFIDPDSLAALNLLPGVAPERVEPVGNAALTGAWMMLVEPERREEAEALAGRVEMVELAKEADFVEVFTAEMGFST